MLGVYFSMATLLLVALLFGGMFLFSAGFADFCLGIYLSKMLVCSYEKRFHPFTCL